FDLDRFVEMRLQGLAHETIEPNDAGIEIAGLRRVEAHQDAAAARGGGTHDGVGAKPRLLHQRAVEPGHQKRAVAEIVGQVIDAGMDVNASAMRVVPVMMRAIVHCYRGSLPYCSRSRSSLFSASRSVTRNIVALSVSARCVIQLPCGRLKIS